MVFGPDGAFYFIGQDYQVIRRDAAGNETVVAGRGFLEGNGGYPVTTKDHGWTEDTGYTGDGGPAVDAQLSFPTALAFDARGNLYISDHGNDAIRKVDMQTGIITTVAGVGPSDTSGEGSLGAGCPAKGRRRRTRDTGCARVTSGHHLRCAREPVHRQPGPRHDPKVDTHGIITTVAGTGQRGYSGDSGPATKAKLNRPDGVVFDAAGNMYIDDENNSRVRMVYPERDHHDHRRHRNRWVSGTGGPATAAQMAKPARDGLRPRRVALRERGRLQHGEEDHHSRDAPSGDGERRGRLRAVRRRTRGRCPRDPTGRPHLRRTRQPLLGYGLRRHSAGRHRGPRARVPFAPTGLTGITRPSLFEIGARGRVLPQCSAAGAPAARLGAARPPR